MMAHDLNSPTPHRWRPSAAMDGLVVCGLFLVCAALIIALTGFPAPSHREADKLADTAAISQNPTPSDDLTGEAGGNDEEGSDSASTRNAPELFPLPLAEPPAKPMLKQQPRKRITKRSWGEYAKPAKSGLRGRAFITLLGDRALNRATFWASPTGTEADFIGGVWTPKNVKTDANGLSLWLRKDKEGPDYTMGEMQAHGLFGYGRYEVIMRPAKGSGTVSSFFTYSGPHMGVPHDEIDIEFLGADTTKIHFNYFHLGKRGTPTIYDLPFDASDALHLYAFEWTPDYIAWYVDGVLFERTPLNDPHIPTYPGKIMFSLWTGTPRLHKWHGRPDFGATTSADYGCVSFTPLGETSRSCSDIYIPPDE